MLNDPVKRRQRWPQFTLSGMFEATAYMSLALASYFYLGVHCIGLLPAFLSMFAFRLAGRHWRQTLLLTLLVYALGIGGVIVMAILFGLIIGLGYALA